MSVRRKPLLKVLCKVTTHRPQNSKLAITMPATWYAQDVTREQCNGGMVSGTCCYKLESLRLVASGTLGDGSHVEACGLGTRSCLGL